MYYVHVWYASLLFAVHGYCFTLPQLIWIISKMSNALDSLFFYMNRRGGRQLVADGWEIENKRIEKHYQSLYKRKHSNRFCWICDQNIFTFVIIPCKRVVLKMCSGIFAHDKISMQRRIIIHFIQRNVWLCSHSILPIQT